MNINITHFIRVFCALFLLSISHVTFAQERRVVLQAFWWDYWHNNYEANWSNYLTELAPRLKAMGIDAIWIPPTVKNGFTYGVGYAPFDNYDLGDKFQKGDVKTRLGTKDDLLRMIAVFHANGIDIIQDIVPNHLIGAGSDNGGGGEDPSASADRWKNFRYTSWLTPATNQTLADYSARTGRFNKNWQNFHPNDDNNCTTGDICQQMFGPDISYSDGSHGNSSNLANIPVQTSGGANNGYMRKGVRDWLIWYKKQTGFDGVRLDAVKHYDYRAGEDFLANLQTGAGWASGGTTMFAVGEFVGSGTQLNNWADLAPTGVNTGGMNGRAGTFDFGLRGWSDGLAGITFQGGAMNLGTAINNQQSSRGRTVPFVNNHDTYRPILLTNGNFSKPLGDNSGWRTGDELAPHVDPRDPRLSVSYAIMMAVDGAPQIFIEDLFDLGTEGNRYTHDPKSLTSLKVRSDLENLLWCRQNLDFMGGTYLVRNQGADLLVIERGGKAIIGTNDNWNTWQDIWVETSFPIGTNLKDYSGASGTAIRTVRAAFANGNPLGVNAVQIAIPPCDGTALQGRRGYSVWAPDGIMGGYVPSRKAPAAGLTTTTQEWEMANDLGDSHCSSLGQGGALPANSTVSRLAGKIYAAAGTNIVLDLFLEDNTKEVIVSLHSLDGLQIFAPNNTAGSHLTAATYTATYTGWYTLKVRNFSSANPAQKVFVKATYTAPTTITDAMGTAALNTAAVWTGAISSNWTECRNWEQGVMPIAGRDMLVPNYSNAYSLNVTGNLQCRNIIIQANVTLSGASSSINASGNMTLQSGLLNNAGTVTVAGNLTVEGMFPQTIMGVGNISIGGNMTVNKAASGLTITSRNNFTIIGDFTQTLGNVSLNYPTLNFNVGGNFAKVAGTFTHTAGKVVFNGVKGLQTISGAVSFRNVDINKNGGTIRDVKLMSSISIIAAGSVLRISAGKLDLNDNVLTITPNGNLQEDLPNNHVIIDRSNGISGAVNFGSLTVSDANVVTTSILGSGLGLQNGAGNSADINITRKHNLIAGSVIKRYYELQVIIGTFADASMQISYAAEDLAGVGVAEASMKLNKYIAPSTFNDVGGVMNVPSKQITQTGGLAITGTENFAVGVSTSDVSVTTLMPAINENAGTTTFVFSRGTGTTGDLVVDFTYAGTAALTADYTVSGATTYAAGAGTVTILNGNSTASITITAVNNQIQEANKTITVLLSGTGYTIGTPNNAMLTINNDDFAGATFSKANLTTTRYGGVDTYTYRLNSQPTANVTINLASDNTVGGGTVLPASLTFTSANWATPQTVTVTGANGGSGTVAYNITSTATSSDAFYNGLGIANLPATNIDQVPIITITAGTAAGEPATNGSFNIALSVARSVPTTVTIAVSGTATGGGTDYTLAAGTNISTVSPTSFTFAAGQTTGTLSVNIANDGLTESREYAIITLAAGTGYTVGVANQATLTINDDESLTLLDGVISPGEYGDHSNGQNAALLQGNTGQDWYMTWDNNNLYVAIATANINEASVLYLGKNPNTPIDGGTDANGSNQSFNNYDNTNFAQLPFRADLVLYLKGGVGAYHEYRTANGSNGWSAQTSNTLATGFGATGNIREFILPWSTIGGMPTSMAFFGYVAYNGGVYGQTPSENAGGAIGSTARYEFYHSVPSLATDKPFARKSYVYNSGSSKNLTLPAYIQDNNLVVHDFTMNTASQTLTRDLTGSWTVNGTMSLANGTVNFATSGLGTNINALNISDAGATLNCNAITAPVTVTNFTQSNGTLTLSSNAASSLRVLGNWNKSGGTFTTNSRVVSFEGNTLQTITHNAGSFAGITINNPMNVNLASNISTSGIVTLQNGKLNVVNLDLDLGTTGSLLENRTANYIVVGTTGKIIASTRSFNTTSVATDIAGLGISLQDGVGTVNIGTINRRFNSVASSTITKNFEFLTVSPAPANATMRISYASDELVGTTVDEAKTTIATINGTTVTNLASTRDVVNKFAETTGITSFGTNYWTIANVIPTITTSGTLTAFTTCVGTPSVAQNYTVSGVNLTADITVNAPAGFEVSQTNATTNFAATQTLTQGGGNVANTTIFVRLTGASAGTPAGNVGNLSAGATTQNVAATGTVNTLPTITGVSAANVTTAATTFNLVYTGTTGTPDQYSITTGATAMLNFVAVTNATLGASPLAIIIPASAANTYDFNLTVRNSTTGCVSAVVPFTLTVTGATVPATALNFDGTDDHVVLANESTFDLATTLTIETRVFTPAVLPGAVQSIINKRNDSKANFGINFSNSFLYFYFNDGNYRLTSLNPNIIPLNQWVHFAYTLEQQGADVRAIAYINGVQVGTDLWVGVSLTNAQNNEPVRLGTVLTVLGNDEFFQGNMDEVRIWNVVKSASELLAKKDCELTGSEPNLLAYYNFNQGDGGAANPTVTALNDAAGTNDVGTLTNFTRTGATSNWITSAVLTACPIPAATATALNFDGTDDHVVLANESTFDLATTLTIETRVFTPAVLPGAVQSIINKRNDSKANFGINFSNSFLYFYFNDGNYRLTSLNPNIIPLNQWVHFAYTLEQQGANVRAIAYINGVQVGTDLWVGVSLTNAQNNEPVRLGTVLTVLGSSEFFQGNMDEVRIWNVVKSQSELSAKQACELIGTEPNLLAYYNFNQGDGGGANLGLISLNDAASPNDAGTLTNFTRTGATSNWITSAVLTGCSSPTITSFLPTSGGVDQVVTITGTNFTGATLVRIGGVSARSFTVVNATTITAVVGDGFTTGLVEVINGATGTSAALTPQNFTRNSCVNTITGLVVTPTTNAGTGFAGFDVSWNLGAGTYTAINVFYKPQSGLGSNFYIGRSFAAGTTSCKLWQINSNSQTYEIYVQGVCTGANSDRVSTTAITTASGSTCSMPVLTPLSVSGTSITFTWNTVPNAYLYQPIYQECDAAGNKINGGQGSTAYLTPAMTATQSWTASQLKPNTFYRFYVRTHCVQGDQSNVISPWSSVGDYVFAQTGAGIACTAPSPTLGASGTTNGYASQVINWAAVPSATNGYGIYFRENSQTNWNVYHLGNVLTYTISGLKQGATYTYFVYGACSNGQAPRSAEATFTAGTGQTYDCNSATTNVSTIFSNPVGATLSWTTTPAGQQVGKLYGVQYVDTNNPTVTNVVYTDSTKISLFAGISSGKTYTYNLQTYCDGIGQWYVNTGTFTTPGLPNIASQKQDETLPAVANFGSALQVYPNPTDNKLTVELGLDNSTNVGIKLTDATGRMVFNETVSANGLNFRHDIDMKNLASGVYMLMVNVEGKTTVKRIVRQ